MCVCLSSGVCRIQQRAMSEGTETLIERASIASQKKILTSYTELHYLLILNKVLFTAFSVDFHNKRG